VQNNFLKVYLAGYIEFQNHGKELIPECMEWRKFIRDYYQNYHTQSGTILDYGIEFFDPLIGESPEVRLCDALIFNKDYLSIKNCDIIISNFNTFNKTNENKRPPIGCYSNDTDILTENGWVNIKDFVQKADNNLKVFTLSDSNQIELQHPTKFYECENSYGYMYNFKSQKIDLMITPNHNIVCMDKFLEKRKFIRADSIPKKIYVPKSSNWEGQETKYITIPSYCSCIEKNLIVSERKILMDDWLNFLGWYISEGCVSKSSTNKHGYDYEEYRIFISQTKQDNLIKIKEAIEKIGCHGYYNGGSFVISDKQIALYLDKTFGKYSYNKFIPKEYKQVSKRQLNILFNSMVLGDGCIHNNKFVSYYSSSKKLMDDVQEIVLKLGFTCNIRKRKREGNILKRENRLIKSDRYHYDVNVSRTHFYKILRSNRNTVEYHEKVYCCEVPNHSLYVRRNGKAIWCGNTILETGIAYEMKKQVIVISDEQRYITHPFIQRMACSIFPDVESLCKSKILNIFFKSINTALY
jgi:hypothetical protein